MPSPSWPLGSTNDYAFIITINPDLTISTVGTAEPPIDGIDDFCIGIVNNSPTTVHSVEFVLAGLAYGDAVFGFDAGSSVPNGSRTLAVPPDNIQDFGTPPPAQGILPNGYVRWGYEGPDNFFSDTDYPGGAPFALSGTSVFIVIPGGIPPGGETYFGTEAPLVPGDETTGIIIGSHTSVPSVVQYGIPIVVGFPMVSKGQLLRPDHGTDAGQHDGPAFAKKRRNHWYSMLLTRTQNIKVGTDFNLSLKPVKLQTAGGTTVSQPTLFSGVVTDTVTDDYSFDGMISWQQSRPTPGHILSVGGFIKAQDK